MIETWSRTVVIVIALTCCWAGRAQAQEETPVPLERSKSGRTMFGGPPAASPSLRGPPRVGDYVIPTDQLPQAPVPLHDLKGGLFRSFVAEDLSCNAKHDRACGGIARIELPGDWEYCTHNLVIRAWNHAWYRIKDIGTNHLTIEVDVRGPFRNPWNVIDRVGGNFVATIGIGLVPKGQHAPDRCLPRRPWSTYCHGNTHKTTCYHSDRCATMPAFEVPFDRECAQLEYYRRTP